MKARHKLMTSDDEDDKSSSWNMGVSFFETLSELKQIYMSYSTDRNIYGAVITLADEIDWIAQSIGQEKKKDFRNRIDNLIITVQKTNNTTSNNRVFMQLTKLKRDVWDEEDNCGLLKPLQEKDQTEKSRVKL